MIGFQSATACDAGNGILLQNYTSQDSHKKTLTGEPHKVRKFDKSNKKNSEKKNKSGLMIGISPSCPALYPPSTI
jgi:hypothetical protein